MPTFRQILASMTSYLQSIGSKLTDFTPTSVVYQILAAVASVIDQIYFSIDSATKQAYIHSATGDGLDAKGQDFGVERKQPTPAVWVFMFTKKQTSATQTAIPKGTVITTLPRPGVAPVTFKVNEDSFLAVGSVSALVKATCETPGTAGNITWETPLLIGSATPGIDGVQLDKESYKDGTLGTEIESDEAYRARLLAGMASKAQGTVAWYEQTALSVEGVQNVKVEPNGRKESLGSVDIYIVGTKNTAPSRDLLDQVQAVIDAKRIITDDARVFAPTTRKINVNMTIDIAEGADDKICINNVNAALTAYINSLGIGGGTIGYLYLNQLIRVALEIKDVINIKTVDLGSDPGTSLKFNPFELPQADQVVVAL